ncbi:hypothetical protein [Flavobacterium sp.]|uniref:hypothetical protein n=1 Tax=Flavobacterium sp. TaxID=239 RepID=UPI004034D135
MNYATQHHIGNYQPARTKTATTVAPTVRRVRKLDAKAKGCKTGAERQAESRTNSNASNGILKCKFLPKMLTAQSVQTCQKTERDYFKSLSRLAEHYKIEPMPTKDLGYPYNIALSLWDVETKVKRVNINCDGLKLIQDSKKTFILSEERYDTDSTLFYIPVIPLYKMLRDKPKRKTGQLLLSLCSYLYHIADIPYYRQEESYLYWLYETHKDWVEQDDETDATEIYLSDFRKAEYFGDMIEQKLFNRNNLDVFRQRLNQFKIRNAFDRECWQVACSAFALYTEYPTASIFRNAHFPEQDPYDDGYECEYIGMEKYISFIADTKGWLYENLKDSINNEFNEYAGIEEPTVSKAFDGRAISTANLDFENRLFLILNDLCGILNNYKKADDE